MKQFKFFTHMLLMAIFTFPIILSACGGGGGGGSTTNPETVFPLAAPGADVPGYQVSGNHSGTITVEGKNYNASGTYSYQTKDIFYLNNFGVNAMPVDTLIRVDIPELSLNLTILSTVYLNADSGNNEPVYAESNDGLTGTPIEIHLLPTVGQVGDFGELTSWSYDNGWIETGTWSLESSSAGFANFVQTYSIDDSQNNLISTGEFTMKINELGEPISIKYYQNILDDGVVIDVSGNIN